MVLPWRTTELAGGIVAVLAAAPDRNQPAPVDAWLIWRQYLALLGFVLVAILVLYFFMRWWRRAGPEHPSASDQLTEFRTLYEQGQISREEFDRLRNLLGERMKREMEGPPPAPPAPEQRPAPAPPAVPPAPESRNGPQPG